MAKNGSEDSMKLAEKTWNRLVDAASKDGYREGIEDGSQAVFQKNFDLGYEDGFAAAFELGKYKGLATAFSKDFKHPDDIAQILDKTRRGACNICASQSKSDENEDSDLPSADILDDQRKHVASTLNVVKEYFAAFMEERHVDITKIKIPDDVNENKTS